MKRALPGSLGFVPCLIAGLLAIAIPAAPARAQEGICATVRIRLEQKIAVTRTAFRATLEITNGDSVDLSMVDVMLLIEDLAGAPAEDKWGIPEPVLTGINAVDGTGIISPGTTARIVWTLIPTNEAAPVAPTLYSIGGRFSYVVNDVPVEVPIFPEVITVEPDPRLVVKYFWQRDVFSDDPFTPEVEPAEPFSLGLLMSNIGHGSARNVRITSSQPEIIENERGLLVAFNLIGTQVGAMEITPSLTVRLGDILPGKTAVARFLLTCSLQGQFTEYQASFEHQDPIGDPRLSLIDSVEIFELIHVVRTDFGGLEDGLPDFMTNEIPDEDQQDIPDTVHTTYGSVEDVTAILGESATPVTERALEAVLDVDLPSGWVYIKILDPFGGEFPLQSVMRSDGKVLIPGYNSWQTDRTFREFDEPPVREWNVHLFDRAEPGTHTYTLVFASDSVAPQITGWESAGDHSNGIGEARLPVAADGSFSEPRQSGIRRLIANFSEPIKPTSLSAINILVDSRDPSGQSLDLTGVTLTTALRNSNQSAEINFDPPLPDFARYRVQVNGVTDVANNALGGNSVIILSALTGDATGDRRVNNTDVGAIRSLVVSDPINLGDGFHVRSDINNDGRITEDDATIVLGLRGHDARFIADPVPDLSRALAPRPGADYGQGSTPGTPSTPGTGTGPANPGSQPPQPGTNPPAASADEFRIYYFKEPRDLTPDFSVLAILPQASTTRESLAQSVQALGIQPGQITDWPVGDWVLMQIPEGDRSGSGLAASAQLVGFAQGVLLASPVFVSDDGGRVIPMQQIAIGFEAGVTDSEADEMITQAGAGAPVARNWGGVSGAVLVQSTSRSGVAVLEAAARLARLPRVLFAEPLMMFTARARAAADADREAPSSGIAWALRNEARPGIDLQAHDAWRVTTGSPGIGVALIDLAVEPDHPWIALAPAIDAAAAPSNPGAASSPDPYSTSLAGLIAGQPRGESGVTCGLAPGARAIPVRAFAQTEEPGIAVGTTGWLIEALNLSWSAGARATVLGRSTPPSAAVAVKYAQTRSAGLVHFAPAGDQPTEALPFPGSLDAVVAVGAIDPNGEAQIPSSPEGAPDLVAPGAAISSADLSGDAGFSPDAQAVISGPAAAAAYAAASAALVLASHPWLSAEQVESAILTTTLDLGDAGHDAVFGAGLIQPASAMAAGTAACPGDANRDRRVDFNDVMCVLANWTDGVHPLVGLRIGDTTHDGWATFADVLVVLGSYGSECGPDE